MRKYDAMNKTGRKYSSNSVFVFFLNSRAGAVAGQKHEVV